MELEYRQYVEQASTEVREQMALEGATQTERAIGQFLLVQFEDEEMRLAVPFSEKRIRLSKLVEAVVGKAKGYLNGTSGAIEDVTVFGWVCDEILGTKDTKVKTPSPSGPKPIKRAAPKPRPEPEHKEGELVQGSLFDLA